MLLLQGLYTDPDKPRLHPFTFYQHVFSTSRWSRCISVVTSCVYLTSSSPVHHVHHDVGLLKWVLAMVNYYNVAKGVEPKRKKVAEAEKNLRLAQKDLTDTKEKLAVLNAELASLRSQFADKTTEQQDLKAKAELMERRLLAAERLIAGLGNEKQRWAADIQTLEAAKEQLVGDCLLCSSFLSYTGMDNVRQALHVQQSLLL